MSDQMKGIVPLSVGERWIRVMGYQQVYDIEVSVPCRPLQRSGMQITTNRVDVRALLYEIATGSKLSIDSCPVEWSPDCMFQ